MVLKLRIVRVSLGRLEKVDGHRINEREIPGGFAILWRFEFGDSKLRIRQPWHVTHIVRPEIVQGLERIVVHRRAALQRRIHDDLQRRRGLGNADYLVPVNGYLYRLVLRT